LRNGDEVERLHIAPSLGGNMARIRKPKQISTTNGLLDLTEVVDYLDVFRPGDDDPADTDSQFLPEVGDGTYEFAVRLE
jgi:hypothetical protein